MQSCISKTHEGVANVW